MVRNNIIGTFLSFSCVLYNANTLVYFYWRRECWRVVYSYICIASMLYYYISVINQIGFRTSSDNVLYLFEQSRATDYRVNYCCLWPEVCIRARSYTYVNRTAVGQIRNIGYDHIVNPLVGTLFVLNIIAVRVNI